MQKNIIYEMITNFKLFEKFDIIKKEWLVETKRPNLEIALRKIGYDKSDEELIRFTKKIRYDCRIKFNRLKKVYITLFYSVSDNKIWDSTTLKFPEYDYMGEIEISPEEIEQYKLEKNVIKYNL
jgi:hypothetical protein